MVSPVPPMASRAGISGSSIVLNGSIGAFLFWLKMDYDEHGILEEMSLVYDGEEIFNMEQRSYTKSNVLPLFWGLIIMLLVIVGVIILVVALVVVLIKKSKKKRAPMAPVLIKPAPDTQPEQLAETQKVSVTQVEKESEKILYCPNCGAKKDSDALFCTYCGSKL